MTVSSINSLCLYGKCSKPLRRQGGSAVANSRKSLSDWGAKKNLDLKRTRVGSKENCRKTAARNECGDACYGIGGGKGDIILAGGNRLQPREERFGGARRQEAQWRSRKGRLMSKQRGKRYKLSQNKYCILLSKREGYGRKKPEAGKHWWLSWAGRSPRKRFPDRQQALGI